MAHIFSVTLILINCASSFRSMLAFRVRQRVFHPKGGFELTLCSSLKVLVWPVRDLVFVFVNSFILMLATVLLQVYNVLSLISLLVCMSVSISNNLSYVKVYLI